MGLFACFSGSGIDAAKDETLHTVNRLREENTRLLHDNARLLALNQELRESAKRLQEELADGQLAIVGRIKSMQQQADRQLAESARIAEEARLAREASTAKELEHTELVARHEAVQSDLTAATRKLSDQAAHVRQLEERAIRHNREKAKLLDQIQRRDQALLLARQVIDMVDRTGVLSSGEAGREMAALFPGAQSGRPPALSQASPYATMGSARVVPQAAAAVDGTPTRTTPAPVAPSAAHAQQALDELRRSLPTVRAALDANTPPVMHGGGVAIASVPVTPPASRTTPVSTPLAMKGMSHRGSPNGSDLGCASDAAGRSRGSSAANVMNPLWQMTAEPESDRTGSSDNSDFSSPNPAAAAMAPSLTGPSVRSLSGTSIVRSEQRSQIMRGGSERQLSSSGSGGTGSGGDDVRGGDTKRNPGPGMMHMFGATASGGAGGVVAGSKAVKTVRGNLSGRDVMGKGRYGAKHAV